MYSFVSRPDVDKVCRLLGTIGGDVNISDLDLGSSEFNEIVADLPPIKLALNCIGGDSVAEFARILSHQGCIVSYGSMSKRAISVPSELVAYKNLKMLGFWLADWNTKHSDDERLSMISDIASMFREEKLSYFLELHDFDDFNFALQSHFEPFKFRKVVLNMDHPDRMKEHDDMPDENYKVFDAHSNL